MVILTIKVNNLVKLFSSACETIKNNKKNKCECMLREKKMWEFFFLFSLSGYEKLIQIFIIHKSMNCSFLHAIMRNFYHLFLWLVKMEIVENDATFFSKSIFTLKLFKKIKNMPKIWENSLKKLF